MTMTRPRCRVLAWMGIALAAVAAIVLPPVTPAAAQGEQSLIVAVPDGFGMVFKHDAPDGSMKMMEFVPTGETVDNWKQMITVQHFPKLAGGDPRELASRWSQRLLATCPSAKIYSQSQGAVNGLPATRIYVHVTECGGRPPESVLALVIKGRDAMHMIQHAWRPLPPTPEQLRAATADFDRARLCAAGDIACAR